MNHKEKKIQLLKKEIENLQKKIEAFEKASFDLGSKVKYESEVYYIFEIDFFDPGGLVYSLTKPKKDDSMPSKVIDPKYCVKESDLELL